MDLRSPRITEDHLVKSHPSSLKAKSFAADFGDFGEDIAFQDHKICFVTKFARGKDVLDLGCVQHNPDNYQSRYWLHRALKEVSSSLLGLDLFEEGVRILQQRGYDVVLGDAQDFRLNQTFDVIVAGDLIEHLEDLSGFLECCTVHLRVGGRLIVSTPNPWYWRNTVKAALHTEVATNPEHTCWLCPRTLRQLVQRHGFNLGEIAFGSRYARDRFLPLPKGWRHTSFHAEVYRSNDRR